MIILTVISLIYQSFHAWIAAVGEDIYEDCSEFELYCNGRDTELGIRCGSTAKRREHMVLIAEDADC